MRRAIPVLLILWAVGGLAYAFLRDGSDSDDVPRSATLEPPEEAPVLRGRPVAPATLQAELVPAAILYSAARLHRPDERKRFFAWLAEDAERVLLVLKAYAETQRGSTRAVQVASAWSRNLFSTWSGEMRPYLVHVLGALEKPPTNEVYLAALLGAAASTSALPEDVKARLAAMLEDPERGEAIRILAAEVLLGLGLDATHGRAAVTVVLRAARFENLEAVRRVLARIQHAQSHAFLDDLLEHHARMKGIAWFEVESLKALLAIAPEDPRVRARAAEAISSSLLSVRKVAREALFRGPVEDVLAFLETAPANARIEGADLLLQRGVAKKRLEPHVLEALRSGGFGTRERAVQLLGKVGQSVAEVLPIVDVHLASDDPGRWLSAVRALGALATVPGDKEPAVDRLLAVGRRQDIKVRTAAVQAILMHDARPAPVIELLTFLLDDANAGVRAEAVDALGELSGKHKTARQALERARSDASEQVRELVVYWLDQSEDD